MIDPDFVHAMARYNAWQNKQLMDTVDVMEAADLAKERGAFFGSIFGTLNHLLWGDMLWLNRFDPSAPVTDHQISNSAGMFEHYSQWRSERLLTDGRILGWAQKITHEELQSDLTMFSRVLQAEVVKPMAFCVTHFFNHQTHHRGQIHAMLTAAGHEAPVSDLFFMPEEQ